MPHLTRGSLLPQGGAENRINKMGMATHIMGQSQIGAAHCLRWIKNATIRIDLEQKKFANFVHADITAAITAAVNPKKGAAAHRFELLDQQGIGHRHTLHVHITLPLDAEMFKGLPFRKAEFDGQVGNRIGRICGILSNQHRKLTPVNKLLDQRAAIGFKHNPRLVIERRFVGDARVSRQANAAIAVIMFDQHGVTQVARRQSNPSLIIGKDRSRRAYVPELTGHFKLFPVDPVENSISPGER